MTNQERLEQIKNMFRYNKDIYVVREEEYIKVYTKNGMIGYADLDTAKSIPNIKFTGVIVETYILFEDKEYNWRENK